MPEENLVGTRGAGFLRQMQFFDATRSAVAAQAVGIAREISARLRAAPVSGRVFGRAKTA